MSDLISRENVLMQMKNYHDDCAQTSEYTRLGFETAMEVVKAEPSADIMECAGAIKEYCKKNLKTPHFWCEGCPLYKVMCQPVLSVPCMWDLPESEDK